MDSLSNFLGLNELEVTKVDETVDDYFYPTKVLTCVSKAKKPPCPNCGSFNTYLDSTRYKEIRDLDASEYRIKLNIGARCYYCNDCKKYYTEELQMVSRYAHSTKRFAEFIGGRCLNYTYARTAADYGISPTQASNCFRDFINTKDEERIKNLYAPRVLGIDEAHLCPEGRGKEAGMRGVFVDVENKTILDITKDRKKESVIKFLNELKDSNNLKVVTIDMWDGYRQAVYEVFGNRVLVVVDHFHVIQELIKQMVVARNNVYSHLPTGTLKDHKNNLSLLKMNVEDLSSEGQRQLNRLIKAVPEVETVYVLKESFRAIYNNTNRKDAEKSFEKWCKEIPENDDFKPFKSVERTVRKWHKEIFNFFDTDGANNATTEAFNGLIKKINRDGNGYSFDVLRAKVLYGAGRKAYTPIRSYNSSTRSEAPRGVMQSFLMPSFEPTKYRYGVSFDWLEEEIDSGDLFKLED